MPYEKTVIVLDDEDNYEECTKKALLYGQGALRRIRAGGSVALIERESRLAAHYAREAMKYKAVM